MRKYVYENATVYITEPTEEQKENIRRATERFAHKLVKEGLFNNDKRRNNRRIGRTRSNARKRNQKIKREDSTGETIHRSL